MADNNELNTEIAGLATAYALAIAMGCMMHFSDSPVQTSWPLYVVAFSLISLPFNLLLTGNSARDVVRNSGFGGALFLGILYIGLSPFVFLLSIFYRVFKILFALLP